MQEKWNYMSKPLKTLSFKLKPFILDIFCFISTCCLWVKFYNNVDFHSCVDDNQIYLALLYQMTFSPLNSLSLFRADKYSLQTRTKQRLIGLALKMISVSKQLNSGTLKNKEQIWTFGILIDSDLFTIYQRIH